MPLVFIFLLLTLLSILFYGGKHVLGYNKTFLCFNIILLLCSFFTRPLNINDGLSVQVPVMLCFLLFISHFLIKAPKHIINKSIIGVAFILITYILLAKTDTFLLHTFNTVPAVLLVVISNTILFNTFKSAIAHTFVAFFVLEMYSAFFLLGEISFASSFSLSIISPVIMTLLITFLFANSIIVIKNIPKRRRFCEN